MKEEKERRSVKATTNQADPEFLAEMFDYTAGSRQQLPLNRHGRFIYDSTRKAMITPTTYKAKGRNESSRFRSL